MATSSGTTPPSPTTAAGKYCWRAEYSGNSFYNPSSHTDSSAECFVVVPDCNIYYPYDTVVNPLTSTDFNENEVLREFEPAEIAVLNDTVRLFYNDEHTLSLGVSQVSVKTSGGTTVTTCAISPFPASNPPCTPVPGVNGGFACHVADPQVGTTGVPSNPTNDATCTQNNVDPSGRPVYPALFITDLTLNGSNACSKPWADAGPPAGKFCGDWQWGGKAVIPDDVFGTWKGGTVLVDKTKVPTTVTFTVGADTKKNNYTLGAGSDPVPAGLKNEGYGSEIRWNVDSLRVCLVAKPECNNMVGTASTDPADPTLADPLLHNHIFRITFMVHDGDQNKTGGDVGENCLTVFSGP